MLTEFIKWLKDKKWIVEEYQESVDVESIQQVLSRHKNIDNNYLEFITRIKSCTNEKETVWFNCFAQFSGSSDYAIKWNEYELMSINAARDEHDEEWEQSIRDFWDQHLPIIMSVGRGGYEYCALRCDGKIVYSFEPEFEETAVVAESFEEFLKMIMDTRIIIDESIIINE